MKFETMKVIEAALRSEIDNRSKAYAITKLRVENLKDQEEEHPGSASEMLKRWEAEKKQCWDSVCEAERALADFLEHDWE